MSIARLTSKSARKFADMADSAEEARSHVLSIQNRIRETENQLRNASRETSAEKVLEYEHEIRRQSDRRDLAHARYLSLERGLTSLRAWLAQLPHGVVLQDAPEKFYVGEDADGSSLEASVERCRAGILELQSARAAVARTVLPIEVLHAEADAHVDALAARGRPRVSVERDRLQVRHSVEGYASEAIVLLAWLHPDDMKARLRREIDDMRADELRRGVPVAPRAERVARLAELDERILALEREEEFYVVEAETFNTTIPRRDNASPAAVLGVAVARKMAAVA